MNRSLVILAEKENGVDNPPKPFDTII
jgi:hypothetical protein